MKNNKAVFKWIHTNIKNSYFQLTLITVLNAVAALCSVAFALATVELIDVVTKTVSGSLTASAIRLAFLIVFQIILQSVSSALMMREKCKMVKNIRKKAFSALINKKLQDINKFHTGELINRLFTDTSAVTNAVVTIVPTLVTFVVKILFGLWAILTFDATFAAAVIVFIPIALGLASFYRSKIKEINKKCLESDGKTRSFFQESFKNLLVVKAFNKESSVNDVADFYQEKNYRLNIKRAWLNLFANLALYVSLNLGYCAAMGWGAYRILTGAYTFGTFTALLQLIGKVQSPFQRLSGIVPQYYAMIASVERIMECEALENEQLIAEFVVNDFKSINFKNISFSYDDEPVLNNTDTTINKGDFVAVLGESGIGKSTLLKLILGVLEPHGGCAYIIDNKNEKVCLGSSTRSLFSYVGQTNDVFSGTIKENIIFFDKNVDENKLTEATKAADIYDYICSLPGKYEYQIAENGGGLSEGQLQRIAIARAVYSDSPVILMDEATSALDEKTEISVLNNLKMLKNKTIIFISHKKKILDYCSRVLNIAGGKIIEDKKVNSKNIILASASPRRKELLSACGINYSVLVTDADENISEKLAPYDFVKEISMRKCSAAVNAVSDESAVIIAADTIVAKEDMIFGKPKDEADAFSMLKNLQGTSHSVYTGVSIAFVENGVVSYKQDVCKTDITFKNLTDEEILNYIKTGEPVGKAGAYAIQGIAGKFVVDINGDFNNVVGLPTDLVIDMIYN